MGSSSVRLPALMFLNSKIEKRRPLNDYIYIIAGGGYSEHMLEAIYSVAEDTGSALTQRYLLDFFCAAFPFNSEDLPIRKLDLVQILRRTMFVVLKRDMSLNRRLYQWLLNR